MTEAQILIRKKAVFARILTLFDLLEKSETATETLLLYLAHHKEAATAAIADERFMVRAILPVGRSLIQSIRAVLALKVDSQTGEFIETELESIESEMDDLDQ